MSIGLKRVMHNQIKDFLRKHWDYIEMFRAISVVLEEFPKAELSEIVHAYKEVYEE